MTDKLIQSVASRWARLGVLLNVQPQDTTPDLERLLLDTARVSASNTRLFILAASWLSQFGEYVAKHRLARMIRFDLEPEHHATLGFLLEWARDHSDLHDNRFNQAIDACRGKSTAMPLAQVERDNPVFAELARDRASALSRRWGRWFSEFEIKSDALRPAEWIAASNPLLRERALTGGDLLASALAECQASAGPIASEAELARRCGAARPAIRDALRRLRLAGLIKTKRTGRSHVIEYCQPVRVSLE